MQRKKMKVIYVAGKYSGDSYSEVHDNILKAEKVGLELIARGWAVIIPHLNLYHFERYEISGMFDYTTWMGIDIELLSRSDAIFMMRGWEHSKGATHEHAIAEGEGLDIYYEEHGDFPEP
jgi:hypothetical protein